VEQVEVDARRDDGVVAGKAGGGGLGRLLARRDESVDAGEQTLALAAAGRVAEPLGREEGGDRERLGIPKGHVGEAREAGLEAVDDVVAARGEREREVGADADRHADAAAARDRQRRAERDHVCIGPVEERAPAGEEVGRAGRGREDGDVVPEAAERSCDAGHVLVHVVRLRPRERGDEAHAEAHLRPSLALGEPKERAGHARRGRPTRV
jgi:hypothetical protein